MTAFKCNRCSKLEEGLPTNIRIHDWQKVFDFTYGEKDFDLCRECAGYLKDFMEQKAVENK